MSEERSINDWVADGIDLVATRAEDLAANLDRSKKQYDAAKILRMYAASLRADSERMRADQ